MSGYEQWDIVSGVGITALGVAACRAIESKRESRLVEDPYAEPFVSAADAPVPMRTEPLDGQPESALDEVWQLMSLYMGVRSRFFDDYIIGAVADGVRQVVILAAGLDARAHRLDWPDGCTVFEVDQPRVLGFKDRVLRERGVEPRCERRVVATDLRGDWRSELLAYGFDPGRPTAWLAEGLLPYLPAEAEQQMLKVIHELSAPGSRLSTERVHDLGDLREHRVMIDALREIGFNIEGLFNTEPRQDIGERLAQHGWSSDEREAAAIAERYGRKLPDNDLVRLFQDNSAYLIARR